MLDNNISAQLLKTLNTQRRKNRKDLYAEKYRVREFQALEKAKDLGEKTRE